jgi:Pyrimidine dimer DNA glycosylase
MQTFLPYPSFTDSAKVLDQKRLGKQRVENLQIMKALLDPTYGWQNHPAVKMWRGYETALLEYQRAICTEWTSRGYKDTCLEKTEAMIKAQKVLVLPSWLGNPQFHTSHQSNLLRKSPEFYEKFFPGVGPELPYLWPTEEAYEVPTPA